MDRRRFLTVAGGAAAATTAPALLAACGSGSTPPAAEGAKGVTFPEYVPSQLVKPDFAPTPEGVMAGYYDYPRNLVTAFNRKPAEGLGEVTIMTNMLNPVPPGASSNQFWQELNNRAGANLNITMTPQADYLSKLSTVIASGDLPDIMMVSARLAHRSEVLTRLCANITDLVAGPAVKQYPFLAAIPRDSWLTTAYGGGIYAVPISRAIAGTIFFSRADLISQRGLNPAPANYNEFVELARGMTDPRTNRWAFGAVKQVITFIGNMLKVPNVWREEGGKFTSEHETAERKEALAKTAELYKAGVFHPDAVTLNTSRLRDMFGNGTLGFNPDGYAAWDTLAETYKVEVGALVAPGFNGGSGSHRAGGASFAITAFKKADRSRLEKLLSLCDWLATPLGTNEYMFRKFGVEGTHYTWQADKPVLTDKGKVEVKLPLEYVAESPHVLGPGPRARVEAQRRYQEKIIPLVVRNPSEGLYSDANVDRAGEMSKIIDAAELDIVAGRKPISAWDEAVSQWRKAGGDASRAEFEAARATQS